jgi:hypothetical protein
MTDESIKATDDIEKIAEDHVTQFLDGRMATMTPTKFQLCQLVLWGMNHARKVASEQTADLRERLEAYEQMFAKAGQVEFTYAPEVRITTYPATSRTTLHYRDREGDWLNDPLVDTDFTGERKWKAFDSPLKAFEYLQQLQDANDE